MTDNGKPASCRACPLYDSAEGIVWGDGPLDAKEMHVGEAPGEEEGRSKKPFKGGAGRVYNHLLLHAQSDRSRIFVTNVVKCRPTAKGAGGRIVNRTPTDEEIRCCAPLLVEEIERVKPNVIVALGNVPMHTLTDIPAKRGITVARSVPTEGPRRRERGETDPERYKVIGTLHPAGVMRQQHLWPLAVYDLVRARNESSFAEIKRRPWKSVIHAYLPDVGDALLRRIRTPRGPLNLRYYFHDLETTGGVDPRTNSIRCIGIAAEPDEVFCFDWTLDVQRFVAEIHRDAELLTVGQNSEAFDIPFQEAKGFEFNGPTYDTLLGFHQLNSALPKDLASIGASCTDELFWKDDRMYKSGEDSLQHGCNKDVHATGRAFHDQITEMQQLDDKQIPLYFNHIMPLQPVLRKMTRRGMRKNQRTAAAWSVVLTRKANELEAKLKKGLGDPLFNVDSPKQLSDLLYTRMGLPIQWKQERNGTTRPSVDAEALDNLALVTNNPIFTLVRSIRTLRKWDSTYVRCEQDENHYVHSHFGSGKAATGRLNSYDPAFQNWPMEIREIMVSDDDDHVIIARDWSQIEWRIAMVLSGDEAGLSALASGRDAHRDSYAEAYGRDYNSVNDAERYLAKTINYGLLYGRGIESLAAGRNMNRTVSVQSTMDINVARDYHARFLARFSAFGQFLREIERQVRQQHWVATAWGRRRWWYTAQNMPEAYNYPMQGNAAHMMYQALIDLEAQLPAGATLRATIHDECLVVAHKSVAAQAEECMTDVMEQRFPQIEEASLYPETVRKYFPTGWRCPSDGHVGMTWRACKPDSKQEKEAEKELRKRIGMKY